MKKEQRIWNEQELKSTPGLIRKTRAISGEYWIKEGCDNAIVKSMVGKTVDYCKDKGMTVLDWMIAKTEEETVAEKISKGDFFINEDGGITVNSKTYIEKQTPKTVTLDNGTVLEVGKKYTLDNWGNSYCELLKIYGNKVVMMQIDELDEIFVTTYPMHHNWLPYTEQPAEKPKEWKTFLIEYDNGSDYGLKEKRVLVQHLSIEDAKINNPSAKSIVEVKLNFEEVNN